MILSTRVTTMTHPSPQTYSARTWSHCRGRRLSTASTSSMIRPLTMTASPTSGLMSTMTSVSRFPMSRSRPRQSNEFLRRRRGNVALSVGITIHESILVYFPNHFLASKKKKLKQNVNRQNSIHHPPPTRVLWGAAYVFPFSRERGFFFGRRFGTIFRESP